MSDPRAAEESFAAENKKAANNKWYAKRFSQQEIDELYKAFKFFDKDSSGCLSRSELRNMLKSLHGNVENQYVNHVMSQVDLNNDGFISFQEFLIAAQS
jgi:calcium-dependent protein kinase